MSAPACPVCELHAESTFKVEGMDCHEEVAILERRLKRLSGLEALDADVLGQRLRIKYDAARLSTASIAEAVAQTGMRAWLEHEEPAPAPGGGASRERLVFLAGFFLVTGLLMHAAGIDGQLSWAPFLASVLLGGVHTGRRALASARAGALDIHVLMVIAVAGAVLLGEWHEAASVVFLFALAQLLETRAMDRARGAIRALMDLAPAEALVRRNGHERRLPVDDVRVGDVVIVRPGEKLPLDGRVAAGESQVNQAPVTGESLPVDKTAGDEVFAGSINGRGALEVVVSRLRSDSTIARIIHLVEHAQAQRAPSQTFVDRFARVYTPIVLAGALLVAVVPPLAAGAPWQEWFYRALVLLVISCPCALVISTPVSIVSALAAAARKGVLIKGGARLERLADVRCIAFDKTGTLTKARLEVVAVEPLGTAAARDVIRIAASLEAHSEHPVGRAVVERALGDGLSLLPVQGFRALPGRGAEGTVGSAGVVAGNLRLARERGLSSPDVERHVGSLAAQGCTAVIVATGDALLGVIGVSDRPRESARDAVELLPEQKLEAVHDLRRQHGALAMIGDGVNDAPALAAADVGIAMGVAGTDAALETADVALMADELLKIPFAVRLSRATARNIRANIAFSIVVKGAFLALAVTGYATLWMAVAADTGASLVVIANALRLLRE